MKEPSIAWPTADLVPPAPVAHSFFSIGEIPVHIQSDLPMAAHTFDLAVNRFAVARPGPDPVVIHHRFHRPESDLSRLAPPQYCRSPWMIFRDGDRWIYRLGPVDPAAPPLDHRLVAEAGCIGVLNARHDRVVLYHRDRRPFLAGRSPTVTFLPSDQIVLAALLPERGGCYLHAAGAVVDGRGLVFAGPSGAGKSTLVTQLDPEAEVLSDDRIIVRRQGEGYRACGTWSHGSVAQVSPRSAPLAGIFFIEQAAENRLVRLHGRREMLAALYPNVVRPLVSAPWWERVLTLLDDIAGKVPCHRLRFDRSGGVRRLLRRFGE